MMKFSIVILFLFISIFGFSQENPKIDFDNMEIDSVDLPFSYDLRNSLILSPVRTQPNGGCWASASNNVLESILRRSGVGDFVYSDINLQLYSGFNIERKAYGNHLMSTAYYTRGSGPLIKGSDFDSVNFMNAPGPLLVTDARFLPNDPKLIKQTIQDFGPVYSMMYFKRQEMKDSVNHIYYTYDTNTNHVVSLVGWNDTMPTKKGRGAWIAQNSLGKSFAEKGFFYIPYQDPNILYHNALWNHWISDKSAYDLYYYDTLGAYNSYGFYDSVCAGMVEFTAQKDGVLDKVGTWITTHQTTIKVKVYTNFNKDNKELGGNVYSGSAKFCRFAGYYSYDLKTPLELKKDEKFYIVVTYINSMDKPLPIEQYIKDYSSPHITSGKCWINPNPEKWPISWYEVGINSNYDFLSFDLCIRAYFLNN